MRGFWNSLWLGLKPSAQFLVGAFLFAADRDKAGLFYALLLVWTLGYSICAVLIDRQIVVLAQQADAKPASAFRSLLPYLLGIALVLTALIGPAAAVVAHLPLGLCTLIVGAGALSGISEAAVWAILADQSRYRTLAGIRCLTVSIFVCLAVWAFRSGGANIMAAPIVGESLVMFLCVCTICGKEIFLSKPAEVNFGRALGFWMLGCLIYFYQQLDFWWTTAVLSKPDLAAYRLGATPRSFLLLGMSAVLQPILFRISSRSWQSERPQAQQSATRATDFLVAANSAFIVVSCAAFLLHPKGLGRYNEALQVAWALIAVYAATGWLGNLGSTLMTNHGAIRLPAMVVTASILSRAIVYGLLLHFGVLNLALLIASTETVAFCGQLLFWRYVLRSSIWVIEPGLNHRLVLRASLALASLGFALATKFSTTSLLLLIACHVAIAIHAGLQRAKRELQPDIELLQDAA